MEISIVILIICREEVILAIILHLEVWDIKERFLFLRHIEQCQAAIDRLELQAIEDWKELFSTCAGYITESFGGPA